MTGEHVCLRIGRAERLRWLEGATESEKRHTQSTGALLRETAWQEQGESSSKLSSHTQCQATTVGKWQSRDLPPLEESTFTFSPIKAFIVMPSSPAIVMIKGDGGC